MEIELCGVVMRRVIADQVALHSGSLFIELCLIIATCLVNYIISNYIKLSWIRLCGASDGSPVGNGCARYMQWCLLSLGYVLGYTIIDGFNYRKTLVRVYIYICMVLKRSGGRGRRVGKLPFLSPPSRQNLLGVTLLESQTQSLRLFREPKILNLNLQKI